MIYAAMPALGYLNASIIRPLLEPLLPFQTSPHYENPYAAPVLGDDITLPYGVYLLFRQGGPYPAAPGNAGNNSVYGIESTQALVNRKTLLTQYGIDSGNMLILVLAHARTTGDG